MLPGPLRFARMAGSSIGTPAAVLWITDFLNAAYYARPGDERDPADLRLAHGILTTRWSQIRGRLGARHVVGFHRAFGRTRFASGGRLGHDELLEGGCALLGDWFADAWQDDERRAYGIAFETSAKRSAFSPESRLRRAALHDLTPPLAPAAQQRWATYDPVSLPDPDAALRFLTEPARWPDMGSANGRFTPLRSGGLAGQTFEIEVVAEPTPRSPVFTRGYVTCTTLETAGSGELDEKVGALIADYTSAMGEGATPLLTAGGKPIALLILTTHRGHFLGRARSHLLVWADADGAWIRDVGAWDPLPLHIGAAYATFGEKAQHEFWGPEPAERSMLAQLALVTGGA